MKNKIKTDCIQRLREYVREDEYYTKYKNGELQKPDDFEQYCIEHCQDIEDLLNKYSLLRTDFYLLADRRKKQNENT